MKMTGAQAIVACLREQGVDTVFGYPGGSILPLYDALYDAPIKHILTNHEQGAVHAADGYARASGRVGVCLATGGPGATNLVTGLANAYLDSVPLVAITGQVPTYLIGGDAFQEVDTTGITMSVTKHNFLVKDVRQLPEIVRFAFRIATSGRPGPVLIDVPRDVQTASVNWEEGSAPDVPAWELSKLGGTLLDRAASRLAGARRPVLMVGGGVIGAGAQREVVELAEKLGLPVVSTLMGLGLFGRRHPLFLGMTGMHGSQAANKAVCKADVLLAVGSRFSDRVTGDRCKYADGKVVIHIDVDPAELDKNVTAHIGLAGDVRQLLQLLLQRMPPVQHQEWLEQVKKWQRQEAPPEPAGELLTAPWLLSHIGEQVDPQDCTFVTDVGQHQMWSAQYLPLCRPRGWITSGGLGTMGFGLPAAIGAQLATPHKRVIHLAGDGGFKMTGGELATVAAQGLPIISIIIDNACLGMVRQWQQLFYQQRYAASLAPLAVDFVAYAAAFGIQGAIATTPAEFAAAFAAAKDSQAPHLIVARIGTEDLVTPMIAPNSGLDKYVDIK